MQTKAFEFANVAYEARLLVERQADGKSNVLRVRAAVFHGDRRVSAWIEAEPQGILNAEREGRIEAFADWILERARRRFLDDAGFRQVVTH